MKITDLQTDPKNANKGNTRGNKAIRTSLEKYGAGRSILLDRNGTIIAGNKTVENAQAAGVEDVIVVPTDGSKLVAVQRTDLDLSDPKARELAIADNRTGELSLEWDGPTLAELSADLDLKPFFTDAELNDTIGTDNDPANDPNAEYEGMPKYSSEDQMGVRKLIVHFKTLEDLEQFSKAIGQKIPPKAPSIWYPRVPNADMASKKYV